MKKIIILLILFIILFKIYLLNSHPIANKLYASIGKKKASKSKIILASCVRNCEDKIKYLEKFYNYFSRYFESVKMVVLENDSKDNTRRNLLRLRKKINIDLVGCGVNSKVCNMNLNDVGSGFVNYMVLGLEKKRVRRMAHIRNILLGHIKKIQKDYDYCIMIDGDMEGEINTNGLLESIYYLDKYKDIDAISCYGVGFYSVMGQFYDRYAYEPIKGNKIINQYFSHFNRGLIKVKSSFNGLTIYGLPFLEELKYNEMTNTCEHIDFHKEMNIYINRNFILNVKSH